MRLRLIMPTKLSRLKREAVYSIACEDELKKNVQRANIGLPDYLGGCPITGKRFSAIMRPYDYKV